MSKFKKGDRVVNLQATDYTPKGAIGTVDEDESNPFVIWDSITEYAQKSPNVDCYRWAQDEDLLRLADTTFQTFLSTKYPLYSNPEMKVNMTVKQLVELVEEWEKI